MRSSGLILVLIIFFCFNGWAQDREAIIQQRIEFISEQLETEDLDLTNVIEILNYRFNHPLNLNQASFEELQEIGLLSDLQINDLMIHIKKVGKLISIYELQALKYWDLETIYRILPFIKVDDRFDQLHVSLKEAFKQGNFEAYLRYQRILEEKKGYTDVPDSVLAQSNSYYYGNADRYYTRLRFSYRTNLSVGLTAEKDPGEQFFKGTQKQGFDFYSFHAYYNGGKYLRKVALGDYQVQIGQGLNLWSGYAFNKTADAPNVKRTGQSIKPYTSVDETRFLRGAAVELGWKNFALTTFASVKKVDGSSATDSLADELEFVSSINLTGFHRTNSELEKKNSLTESIIGGNLRYRQRAFEFGVAAISWNYNKPYQKSLSAYNQFDFRGKNTTSFSGDYSFVARNFHFFGELSYVTYSNSFAMLQGVMIALDPRVTLSLLYRNYQRGYETFYNNGFSEGSQTKNEQGIYSGIHVQLNREWSINSYFDYFNFPWLKYQVDAPSRGHEFLVQPNFRPSKKLDIYARFRQQLRQKNSRDSDGTVTEIEDVYQRNYRLNLSYKIGDDFTIKSRIEYVTINRPSNKPEQGMIFSQDLLYKPKKIPVDLALRYAVFDTDSYDSRIYTYESNAQYVFAVPAYYYQGSRAYVLLRYTFLKRFDLWARYGVFIYSNRKTLSSGAEQINQPQKSDLTLQLRIKL